MNAMMIFILKFWHHMRLRSCRPVLWNLSACDGRAEQRRLHLPASGTVPLRPGLCQVSPYTIKTFPFTMKASLGTRSAPLHLHAVSLPWLSPWLPWPPAATDSGPLLLALSLQFTQPPIRNCLHSSPLPATRSSPDSPPTPTTARSLSTFNPNPSTSHTPGTAGCLSCPPAARSSPPAPAPSRCSPP